MNRNHMLAAMGAAFLCGGSALAREKLHFTYLWHLEQPIYWPDRQVGGADRYERAKESLDRGGVHPENNLVDIFGLDDRKAAYQWRVRDSVNAIRGHAEAGAQVSYSGGLIENIMSLGAANSLGYSPTWYGSNREARGWSTVGQSKPRLDIVLFAFHHPLLPLCDDATVRREIQLYKEVYADAWGSAVPASRGFFPSEMAFSTRLIQPLAQEGVAWSFVSGEKISRANVDFPVIFGSGGINCDPPNPADQLNAAQGSYYRVSISRGCGPAEAYPQSFTPQRAQTVDPNTGQVYEIIVVPCSQSLGWQDGYAPLGIGDFNALQVNNNPNRPMLVTLAHDGDNAWGGGFSYYLEATPNLVNAAQSAGYVASTVEEYLADHPVPANAIVHVEDGAWVNADGDFGAPQFINWNWPLLNAQGQIDVENGWHIDARNWAVITAMQNRVETAEQIAGGVNVRKILYPDGSTTGAERAWHYFLGALNSGFMYYGTPLDHEVKQAVACNEAARCADPVIGNASLDQTAPTIWLPQRHPWNPGAVNFGPQYGYQQVPMGPDFWVWSFIYDTSGLASVTLKYRTDVDGVNSPASWQNETYAGGAEVGGWQSIAMTQRAFPAGNVFNDPQINFFEMPQYIANQYHAKITGISGALVDYYIEATDTKGYTKRSPIQHVWVGTGSGGGGPGGEVVTVSPATPVAGQPVTITYDPAGRPLAGAAQVRAHVGINGWMNVLNPDPLMTFDSLEGVWTLTTTLNSAATVLDLAFNNGAGSWDNNSGADWHFAVTGASGPAFTMDGALDSGATLIASNGGASLWAKLVGDQLYVACPDAGEGQDKFILLAQSPGAMQNAPWGKSGQVAAWSAFLADENDNDYEGWFDAVGSRDATTGANGGVLEGWLNVREEFGGTMPPGVWACAVGYNTPDGGALVTSTQAPAPVLANGNIEANEYIYIDFSVLSPPAACPGDADGSNSVNFDDITAVIANWGQSAPTPYDGGDSDGDGDVDFDDITETLANWGAGCG
jgi:hypothetical protein